MEFKKVSVNSLVYGTPQSGEIPNEGMCQSSVNRIQSRMRDYLNNKSRGSAQSEDEIEGNYLHEFFNFLAVCHTAVCDID